MKKNIGLVVCTLLVWAGLFSSVAWAQDRVHVIQVVEGSEKIPLPLAGWLVGSQTFYTATLSAAPQFGIWQSEHYIPHPSFWEAGGDVFALSVSDFFSSPSEEHLVILISSKLADTYRVAEDFEDTGGSIMGLDPAWNLLGDLSQMWIDTNAIAGQFSLRTQIQGLSQGSGLEQPIPSDNGEPGGIDQVGIEIEINPEPPSAPSPPGSFPIPTTVDLVTVKNEQATGPFATIQLLIDSNGASLRTSLDPARVGCQICATPPRAIPWGQTTRAKLRIGRDSFAHPTQLLDSLSFTVEGVSGFRTAGTLDRLEGLDIDHSFQRRVGLGSLQANAVVNPFGLRLDEFETVSKRYDPSERLLYNAEDFEDASVGPGWSIDGPLTVGTSAASGGWQGQVDLRQLPYGGRAVMTETSPSSNKKRLATSFLLDTRNLRLSDQQQLVIFSAAAADQPALSDRLVWIELKKQGASLQVRAVSQDGHGTLQPTSWLTVADIASIFLDWQATVGSTVGKIHLWVDGQDTSMRNSETQGIQSISIGAQNVKKGFAAVRSQILGLDNIAVWN